MTTVPNTTLRRARTFATAACLLAAMGFAPAALAQSDATGHVSVGNNPDEAVQLSPFEVSTTSDKGYAAMNSNSVTLFRADLDKLPISADIFDATFMEDVGATSVESLVQSYSAGAGVSNVA